MKDNHVSTIGRPVDPDYPTNRAIGLITIAAMAAGFVYRLILGARFLPSLGWGISAGLSVFLTWALARELDPDHDLAAFVAAAVALVGTFYWAAPMLGFAFWVLLVVRLINHTTGRSASLLDTLGVVLVGAWLTYRGNWGVGLLTTLALAADASLPRGKQRQWVLAGVSGVLALTAALRGDGLWPAEGIRWVPLNAAVVLAALFVWVILDTDHMESVCDQTPDKMDPVRIRAGQILSLLILIEYVIWRGWPSLWLMMPLTASLVGILLLKMYQEIQARA